MTNGKYEITCRAVLAGLGAAGLGLGLRTARAAEPALSRVFPKTNEPVPAIGMGSWISFNVGDDEDLRAARAEVLRAFFAGGGALIDSSPMYGSSQEVIGDCLKRLGRPKAFAATKVWHAFQGAGIEQMAEARALWGVAQFDLMQVHNLLAWESHLETLIKDKAEGRVRYIGLTTSHGSRHEEMEEIMRGRAEIDAVQFTYNILDREAEERLLPLAAEKGLAVVINRPFRRGALFDHVKGRALPGWAGEIGAASWAQVFLKFVLAHPAVTCAIPATSNVAHMVENMAALKGPLPDAAMRQRMIKDVEGL